MTRLEAMTKKPKTIRVLLAEDHVIVREGLRRLLEEEPDIKVVGEADNGREAARLAEELRPDVVVMDLSMPELNGIDATRKIAGGAFSPKVLCLSMRSDRRTLGAMLRAGAAGYLVKGCAADELVAAIRAVASGQTYISPAVAGCVVDAFVRTRPEPSDSAFAALTLREREVLQLLAEGFSAKETALRLGIAQKTVLAHRVRLMEKLGLRSEADLTRYAIREGLTEL